MSHDFKFSARSYSRSIYEGLIFTSLYLAGIAVAESFIVIIFLDLPLSLAPIVIGLLVFSVYVNDQLIDLENDDILNPRERSYISRHKDVLYVFASVSYGIALSLSVWGGLLAFAIALIPGIAWIFYASDIFSDITSWIGIPLSQVKEVFFLNTTLVAVAWAVTLLFIPVGFGGSAAVPTIIAVFSYFFFRVFKNTEISNIPDRASDLDHGISTLPTMFGVTQTRWVLHGIDVLTAGVVLFAVNEGYIPALLSLALFAGILYSSGVVALVEKYRNRGVLTRLAEYEYLVVFGALVLILFQRTPEISISIRQLMPLTIAASLMIAIGIGISAGLLAWREYPEPGSLPLVVMLAGQSWWSVTLFLEFQATSLATKLVLADIRWIGIVLIPVGWLWFSLEYTGHNRYLKPQYIAGLLIIPLFTVFLALTGPYNSLLYQSSEVITNNGLSFLSRTGGPWFWVIAGYTYVLGMLGAIPLLDLIRDNNLLFRGQSTALLVGIAAPWIANAAFLSGAFPLTGFDPTPLAFGISGVAYLGALTRFQLLGFSPTPSRSARRVAYERMGQGAIVVDRNDFIIDINPKAIEMLGTKKDDAMGDLANNVVPDYEELPDGDGDADSVTIRDDERSRSFEVTVSTIRDPYGRATNKIITLNDITDLIDREQRISVLNRILRHNIRNELNVVEGHLGMLEDQVRADGAKHVKKAQKSTHRVIRFAERARHVEESLREDVKSTTVAVAEVVDRLVTESKERYPQATVDSEFGPATDAEVLIRVIDEKLFEMALIELIENAIMHHDSETPEITIRVTAEGGQVRVSVADDGPGIPEQEKDVLQARSETALDHSSGLGLWLVKWTVSLSEGSLAFSEVEPRGSEVSLTFAAPGDNEDEDTTPE